MNTFVKASILLLVISMSINASEQVWQPANQIDIPFSINGVDMLKDGMTGWAVCNAAMILKTTDGWKTWKFQAYSSDLDFSLYDVDFIDANYGWAVGGGEIPPAVVLFTRDGGQNWLMQSTGLTHTIYTISAVDSNHAWCGGKNGIIYRTEDHETWHPCTMENTKQINAIHLAGSNNGVAVCDDQTIFSTTDGLTWQKSENVPEIGNRDINNVWMTDAQTAWAVGDASDYFNISSYILKSEDGGDNWVRTDVDVNLFERLTAIKFDTHGNGIAAGAKGIVFVTEDGNNWTRLQRKFASETQDVAISDNKIWSFSGMGIIQYSDDFGNNWNLIPKATGQPLYKMKAISDSCIMAVGYYSAIMRSDDGGRSWYSDCVIANEEFSPRLEGIDFVDDITGWVCGSAGYLAKTTDGGKSWINQSNPEITEGGWLYDVEGITQNTMWCCGRNGLLISGVDGGEQLIRHDVSTSSDLIDIDFFNSDKGIIVGNGVLLYTTDAGASWNNAEYDSGTIPKIISCQLLDSDFSVALGYNGNILKSYDLGQHWAESGKIEGRKFTSILFKDKMSGWASNSDSLIFYTEDGGSTWTELYHHTQGLYSLTNTTSTVFACGLAGTIAKADIPTSVYTVESRQPNQPGDYVLYQNYPNPFNSSTNIVYQVIKPQHIFAAVYNTLGEEVEILANDFKPSGTYIHHLHMHNRSSGVYYVKISAGNQISTKRIVHIK